MSDTGRVSVCSLKDDKLTILKDFTTVGEATIYVNGDAGKGEFHVLKWHLSQENGAVEIKTVVKAVKKLVYNPRVGKNGAAKASAAA